MIILLLMPLKGLCTITKIVSEKTTHKQNGVVTRTHSDHIVFWVDTDKMIITIIGYDEPFKFRIAEIVPKPNSHMVSYNCLSEVDNKLSIGVDLDNDVVYMSLKTDELLVYKISEITQ